jgi:hypothetical protein
MAIFSLSIIGTTTAAFSPFDRIQVKAAAQQENNNNTKLLSLSTINSYRNRSSRYWSYSNCTWIFKDKKSVNILGYIFIKNP